MGGDPVRLVVRVSGRVQGVGFRFFAVEEASVRRLVGYARNLRDGDVEVVAEGPRGALEDFLQTLRRGPRSGRVERATLLWDEARGDFEGFGVRYESMD